MIIITDNPKFADKYFKSRPSWQSIFLSSLTDDVIQVGERLLKNETVYMAKVSARHFWQYMFFVEFASESQYDVLTEFCRNGLPIPRNTLCVAGSGRGFHGQHGRHWAAEQGNIHVSAYFQPSVEIKNFGAAFHVVPALSAAEAIDNLRNFDLPAGIKWVNDIVMGNSKVGGIIAFSQTRGPIVTDVVLGIGLNVGKTPVIEPTHFVPEAGCLAGFARRPEECSIGDVFEELITCLENNYKKAIQGNYNTLLGEYIKRSSVIGKEVRIMSDDLGSPEVEIARGEVESIGDNLELFLKGFDNPVWKGRLAFL